MALIHYWPFDSNYSDAVGSIAPTPGGAPSLVSGKLSDALLLPDQAYISLSGGYVRDADWSVSFWINRISGPGRVTIMMMDNAWANGFAAYPLGTDIYIDVAQGGAYHSFVAPLTDNQWHHAVVRRQSGEVKAWLDNFPVSINGAGVDFSVALSPPLNIGHSSDSSFGTASASGTSADHVLDDVAIFDDGLTESKIAYFWNDGNGNAANTEPEAGPAKPPLMAPQTSLAIGRAGLLIGVPRATVMVDWAAMIDPLTTRIYYALDVVDGESVTRIPISSWQATVQNDRASYAQAVIPNAVDWAEVIAGMTNPVMVIYRGALMEDETRQESEMARAPIQTPRLDEGPTNATMTISGYASLPAGEPGTRTLQNVRSQSGSQGLRVRCDVDWFLRPGQTAIARGVPFQVGYINYYVTGGDQYMDVGERSDG